MRESLRVLASRTGSGLPAAPGAQHDVAGTGSMKMNTVASQTNWLQERARRPLSDEPLESGRGARTAGRPIGSRKALSRLLSPSCPTQKS
ncbi:hypothetical protein BZL30_4746 [Mycobacterium kansasii]|uniref:Uncharacterized protein n=1 Tax=Mycobacterium kansasii TaxID=1768 RepID=A0A1V3X462_MYCKA|nr:hypothetical protein BZL30_4746 [Mycobacterium kansasii]